MQQIKLNNTNYKIYLHKNNEKDDDSGFRFQIIDKEITEELKSKNKVLFISVKIPVKGNYPEPEDQVCLGFNLAWKDKDNYEVLKWKDIENAIIKEKVLQFKQAKDINDNFEYWFIGYKDKVSIPIKQKKEDK